VKVSEASGTAPVRTSPMVGRRSGSATRSQSAPTAAATSSGAAIMVSSMCCTMWIE